MSARTTNGKPAAPRPAPVKPQAAKPPRQDESLMVPIGDLHSCVKVYKVAVHAAAVDGFYEPPGVADPDSLARAVAWLRRMLRAAYPDITEASLWFTVGKDTPAGLKGHIPLIGDLARDD